jgi:ABC-2 type transport system ATP-binding protein
MKVKLALALALAPRPALLILDEPTSGLDPVARREFLDLIQRQARDHRRTTFFSSHLIGEVERVADRVGIIHQGKMRYEGDLGTLRASVRQLRMKVRTGPAVVSPLVVPALAGQVSGSPAVPGSSEPVPAEAGPTCLVPPGFTVLREAVCDDGRTFVLEAAPSAWDALQLAEGEITPLPLEDIFIALVGTPPAVL